MASQKYILVLLYSAAISAMEHKQLQIQQHLLKHHTQQQQSFCKHFQEKPNLEQKNIVSLSPEVIHPAFEWDTQDHLSFNQTESNSSLLNYINPLAWARATFSTVSGYFSYYKKPTVDWNNPFKIKKGDYSYTTEGGGKRYFVIRDDTASDVFDMDFHEKVLCHKIETKIIAEQWSGNRTHYAVCETQKIVIHDVQHDQSVVIPFENPQQNISGSFWQNGDHLYYIAIISDQIIIEELLRDKRIIIGRKGHTILEYVHKENVFGIIFDDKKCIFYDIKRDYKPIIELQAQDSIKFEIFSGNSHIPLQPVWIDKHCKFFDMNTGEEIFSQPQTHNRCLDGVWNKQQNKYLGFHFPKDRQYLYDVAKSKIYTLFSEENSIPYYFWGFNSTEKYLQGSLIILRPDDARFVVYDMEDEGKLIKSVKLLSPERPGCRLSGNNIAIALSKDNVVEIYDLKTGRGTTKDCNGKHFAFFGRHPRYYAWSLDEKTIFVYDAFTTKDYKLDFDGAIHSITFDKKHGHLLVQSETRMHVFDVAKNTRITSFELPVTIDRYVFSPDGKWLIIGSKENREALLVYDVSNNYKPVSDKPLTFDSTIESYFFLDYQNELYNVVTQTSEYVFNLKQ